MKKVILATALLASVNFVQAQLFMSKNTEVSFFSAAKLEDIEAKNKQVSAAINTVSNDVVVKITNTAFKFKSATMEEHFNENYMESPKYPVSDFKGKINEKVDWSKTGTQEVTVTGKMTMHGVTKDVTLKVSLDIAPNQIKAKSKFKIKVAEYGIKVPSLYVEKIAEEVEVTVNSVLDLLPKK